MKFLKHILVVAALMLMVMPCTHAQDHDVHAHGEGSAPEICATHACSCHSCDTESCIEMLEVQDLSVSLTSVEAPSSSILLMVFSETKPLTKRVPSSVPGILASLQTVQLLI